MISEEDLNPMRHSLLESLSLSFQFISLFFGDESVNNSVVGCGETIEVIINFTCCTLRRKALDCAGIVELYIFQKYISYCMTFIN